MRAAAKYPLVLMACLLLGFSGHQDAMLLRFQQASGSFHILSGSRLYLDGSSNVVKFTCHCDCYDPAQAHNFQLQTEASNLQFSRTQIKFGTRALDCGHRGINTDMYQTLKADHYPHITIELLRTKLPTTSATDQTFNAQALTAITIAGVRRQEWLNIRVQRQAPNKYRFTGAKPLSMASFGLEVPRPMMGLIQVSDLIEINLDLLVSVSI